MSISTQTLYILLISSIIIFHYASFIIYRKKETSFYIRNPMLFIFILGLLIRFVIISFFPFASGYDISSFHWAVGKILEGEDIYTSVSFRHYYAFFPGYAILLKSLIPFEEVFNLSFLFIEKLPIILFDSGIAVLIYRITSKKIPALVYTISPIPLIIGAVFGQFDAIVLFFIIFSLFLFSYKKALLSFLTLGMAITIKPWAILFTIVLLSRVKYKIVSLLFLLFPMVVMLYIYQNTISSFSFSTMLIGVFMYSSVVGWWGPGVLMQIPSRFFASELPLILWGFITKAISLVLVSILSMATFFSPYRVSLWIILVIYIFSGGLSIHYLLWIFPFALITQSRFIKSYLLLVGGYIILVGAVGGINYQFHTPYIPPFLSISLSQILWFYFLLWLLEDARASIRDYIFRRSIKNTTG